MANGHPRLRLVGVGIGLALLLSLSPLAHHKPTELLTSPALILILIRHRATGPLSVPQHKAHKAWNGSRTKPQIIAITAISI